MDFDHLRYFQTLAACGSYTAAAKQLFISQPALSYAISQLEARTEIKLFERTARGVRLTPAGEEYLKHVDRAIEELDIGKARARTIAGGASIVRISLMRVLGAIFLPNAITRFKQAFPDEECKFDLRLGIASEVAADIEEVRCLEIENENNYRTFYMVYSENATLTSAEKRFIEFAQMEVAERGLSNAEMS